MKQLVTMVIACTALILVPAFSSADDRHRGGEGFIRVSYGSVFEKGHQDRHPGKHLGHQVAHRAHEKKAWGKESHKDRKHRHLKKHRHEQQRRWEYRDERRHRHVDARPAPRPRVIRDRVVLNPFPPVLLPSRLVLHFYF